MTMATQAIRRTVIYFTSSPIPFSIVIRLALIRGNRFCVRNEQNRTLLNILRLREPNTHRAQFTDAYNILLIFVNELGNSYAFPGFSSSIPHTHTHTKISPRTLHSDRRIEFSTRMAYIQLYTSKRINTICAPHYKQ